MQGLAPRLAQKGENDPSSQSPSEWLLLSMSTPSKIFIHREFDKADELETVRPP